MKHASFRALRLVATTAAIVGVWGASAGAEAVSVYGPVQPEYTLGAFTYKAPTTDGWRQVTSVGSHLVLVYAESVEGGQINTRAQIDVEAFSADPAQLVGDVLWLTEQSQAQQVKERGDKLVAFSRIGAVDSKPNMMSYALVTRIGESDDMYETFYVVLANDKTAYLVAKLATKEAEYRSTPYFSQFESSLASIAAGDAESAPSAAATE